MLFDRALDQDVGLNYARPRAGKVYVSKRRGIGEGKEKGDAELSSWLWEGEYGYVERGNNR